jgi:O-antigen/teichoic acid export membrane protein
MQKQFRQTLFALFSQGLPMLLGIALIPILIKEMGTERFGFLSVVWSMLGYFGFLDLGISRTITKMVAEEGVHPADRQNFNFIHVGHQLVQWVSVIGAILGSAIVVLNFHHIFKVDAVMASELKWSAVIIMVTVPFVVLTSYYRGLLDGRFKFSESNWIQVCGGILLF